MRFGGTDLRQWDPQWEALARRFRVVRFDPGKLVDSPSRCEMVGSVLPFDGFDDPNARSDPVK